MMRPDDEANTDAPLVPDLRPTNRDATTLDDETIRRELRELRSRIDYLDAYLQTRSDR